MTARNLRVLSGVNGFPAAPDTDIGRIVRAYHAWRGERSAGDYKDVLGFSKSATLDDIRQHGHILTPGRYVGVAAAEEDHEPFREKLERLAAELRQQFAESHDLESRIEEAISGINQ